MTGRRWLSMAVAGAVAFALVGGACARDGGGARRTIAITQTDDGCTPAVIDLSFRESVRFEVTNQSSKDYEFEGIDGTKVEELLVPAGKTRTVDYTAPSKAGTGKVKCYIPTGTATIIELRVN